MSVNLDDGRSRGHRRGVNVAIALAVAALTFGATQLVVALRTEGTQQVGSVAEEPSGSTGAGVPDQDGDSLTPTPTDAVSDSPSGDVPTTSVAASATTSAAASAKSTTTSAVKSTTTSAVKSTTTSAVKSTATSAVKSTTTSAVKSTTTSAARLAANSTTSAAGSTTTRSGAASASSSSAQAPVAQELRHQDPSLEGRLKSDSSGVASTLRIINRRNEQIAFYWLDYSGTRERFGSLEPGGQVDVPTFVDHPWLIARSDGTALFIVLPSFPLGTATVT